MTNQDVSQSRGPSLAITIIIFLIVFVLWLATPLAMKWFYSELSERGQAGDLYGSINALFSGAAFAGVIVAILLQRTELILQREELTLTRTELARSAEAQEESQKALHKTIYAQSFKVAMDILEAPEVIEARKLVWTNLNGKRDDFKTWRENDIPLAMRVIRSFETVGTMIRRGILPPEYIIDTWSVPIVRNWSIVELYLQDLREARKDPFIAQDFEWLAFHAVKYLNSKNVARAELDIISPSEYSAHAPSIFETHE